MAAQTTKTPQEAHQTDAIKAVTPEVLDIEQDTSATTSETLKPEEKARRAELEGMIVHSLKNANQELESIARYLKEIRDDQLYRNTHETWRAYIEDTFPFTRRYADYRITYIEVRDQVAKEHGVPLPSNEAQTRCLASFQGSEQVALWKQGCELTQGGVPSRETMATLARTFKAQKKQKTFAALSSSKKKKLRTKRPIITEGVYVRVLKVEREEYRQYIGYWGLVTSVVALEHNARQYAIALPHGTLELVERYPDVPSEAVVKKISLQGAQKKRWQTLHEQLTALYENISDNRFADNYGEPIVKYTLEYFVRHKQEITISALEKDLLYVLEDRFLPKKEGSGLDSKYQTAVTEVQKETPQPTEVPQQSESSSATDTTSKKEPTESIERDVRQRLAEWMPRSEFVSLTGISQNQVKKFVNCKKLPEGKTVATTHYNHLAIEIDVSSRPYKYRSKTEDLYTYHELVEKYPELDTYGTFQRDIKRKGNRIRECKYTNARKLQNMYIIYHYKFGDGKGLFKVILFSEQNS